jgi:Zn-dependent M28 family amino/carboxypeptidase
MPHNFRPSFIILGLLVGVSGLLLGCSGAGSPQSQTQDLLTRLDQTQVISSKTLAAHVKYLASDALGGRGPGTAGDVAAREYLVQQLQGMGYTPGFKIEGAKAAGRQAAWQQSVPLVGINTQQPRTWVFAPKPGELTRDPNGQEFIQSDDFIVASGEQQPQVSVADAEVVFVGYGIDAPEYQWDDFKEADLKGKVLLMLNNDPHWDPELFAGERRLYYGRWVYKYESAARQGAAGAIVIHTNSSAGYPWQVVQTSWTGTQFELPANGGPRLQFAAWLTQDATRRLLSHAGFELDQLTAAAKRRDFQPVSLGVQTSLQLNNKITNIESGNVVGRLQGSDPSLSDEFVLYSAHHDHLGTVTELAGADQIYNGARDNAAGTAAVLAIAQAWAELKPRPRRSVLVSFVAAEEQGLLGSEYLATHLPVPSARIAANINYDGGNIWGATRDVTYVGYGKSSLDSVADTVAAYQGRMVKGDQAVDKGYFYRSDQLNFARVGIPAMFVQGGRDYVGRPPQWGAAQLRQYTEQNYHQPSDEYDASWDFTGMIADVKFGLMAGVLVANADIGPSWIVGDEFEAARLQSQKALTGP